MLGAGQVPLTLSPKRVILWAAALAVAALGTWIMYDAEPGVNWLIWTACAGLTLTAFVRAADGNRLTVLWLAFVAAIIAGGAVITADQFLTGLICLAVIILLALSMLLSVDPRLERLTAGLTVVAPAVAFGLALSESVRRALDALHLVRSPRARAILRGVAITLPVVLIFGLLLSTADPTFAGWRDAIGDLLTSWAFLPRTFFFVGLLAIVLGAFGYADRGMDVDVRGLVFPPQLHGPSRGWLGSTERLILLTAVSLLFWTFLAVQLSYLFGSLPAVHGSGMTFAEYARRGFAELTVVASCTALLIVVAERYGEVDTRRSALRLATLSVVAAVLFLLGSAFHRVLLYEQAYGFTTARLYAQAYMLLVTASLLVLSIEIARELDPARLFRRTALAAVTIFVGLIYWNHQAWIASRNIDLFGTTGKLDVVYLTRDLSTDAIPTIVGRLSTLPEPARSQLTTALKLRYQRAGSDRWFEWNLARVRARAASARL